MPSRKRNSGGKAGALSLSPNVSSFNLLSDADQVPLISTGSFTSLQAQGGDEGRTAGPSVEEEQQAVQIETNTSTVSSSTSDSQDPEVVVNAATEGLASENADDDATIRINAPRTPENNAPGIAIPPTDPSLDAIERLQATFTARTENLRSHILQHVGQDIADSRQATNLYIQERFTAMQTSIITSIRASMAEQFASLSEDIDIVRDDIREERIDRNQEAELAKANLTKRADDQARRMDTLSSHLINLQADQIDRDMRIDNLNANLTNLTQEFLRRLSDVNEAFVDRLNRMNQSRNSAPSSGTSSHSMPTVDPSVPNDIDIAAFYERDCPKFAEENPIHIKKEPADSQSSSDNKQETKHEERERKKSRKGRESPHKRSSSPESDSASPAGRRSSSNSHHAFSHSSNSSQNPPHTSSSKPSGGASKQPKSTSKPKGHPSSPDPSDSDSLPSLDSNDKRARKKFFKKFPKKRSSKSGGGGDPSSSSSDESSSDDSDSTVDSVFDHILLREKSHRLVLDPTKREDQNALETRTQKIISHGMLTLDRMSDLRNAANIEWLVTWVLLVDNLVNTIGYYPDWQRIIERVVIQTFTVGINDTADGYGQEHFNEETLRTIAPYKRKLCLCPWVYVLERICDKVSAIDLNQFYARMELLRFRIPYQVANDLDMRNKMDDILLHLGNWIKEEFCIAAGLFCFKLDNGFILTSRSAHQRSLAKTLLDDVLPESLSRQLHTRIYTGTRILPSPATATHRNLETFCRHINYHCRQMANEILNARQNTEWVTSVKVADFKDAQRTNSSFRLIQDTPLASPLEFTGTPDKTSIPDSSLTLEQDEEEDDIDDVLSVDEFVEIPLTGHDSDLLFMRESQLRPRFNPSKRGPFNKSASGISKRIDRRTYRIFSRDDRTYKPTIGLCNYFLKGKDCPYGRSCKFSHSQDDKVLYLKQHPPDK